MNNLLSNFLESDVSDISKVFLKTVFKNYFKTLQKNIFLCNWSPLDCNLIFFLMS